MPHLLAFGGFSARNEGGNRLGYVCLNVFGGTFFGISANLSDNGNAVGFGVVLEHFEQVLEVKSHDGVAAYAHSGALSHAVLGEIIHHFVG